MEIKVDVKNKEQIIDAGLEYQQTLIKELAEFEKAYLDKNDADIKEVMKKDFGNLWLGRSYNEAKEFLQIGRRFKDSFFKMEHKVRMGRIDAINVIIDRINKFEKVTLNQNDIDALGL